jgi:rhodanese-related sulfurtransferase/rubrerythrin
MTFGRINKTAGNVRENAMTYNKINLLSSDDLRAYVEKNQEKDYLLIDVRQPEEYTKDHIPGAVLMPLMEFQTKVFSLPSDRDMVFYCHSGGRSMFAADLAAEAEVTEKKIYNLEGGILAWDGKTLQDFPRVRVFNNMKTPSDQLLGAMDLEKGAWRFYRAVAARHSPSPFSDTLSQLSEAETGHARLIYGFWKEMQTNPQPFDALFENLKGDIIEGGESLAAALDRAQNLEGSLCLNLIELAMNIEYSAYDLYRTLGEQSPEKDVRQTFIKIAQAEKAHMKTLARAIETC